MTQTATEAETRTETPTEREPGTPSAPPHQESRPARATLSDDPLRRSPVLATILGMVPGLGQVYVGYTRLGFVHALVFATTIGLLAEESGGMLTPLLALFLGFFWLYGVVDAGRRAMLVNQALLGRLDLDLPQTLGEPGFRGSIPGGVAAIALGALLLANTLFDVSLRWVEDWWPVAVIAFGAFLVYRAIQDRQGRQRGSAEFLADSSEPPADEV